MYFYGARYYSPMFQRFIAQDPIGIRSRNVNLYAYVRNNPISVVDPSGREDARCEELRKEIGDLLEQRRGCSNPAEGKRIENQLQILMQIYEDLGCGEGPDGGGGQELPQESQPEGEYKKAANPAEVAMTLALLWQLLEEYGWLAF